MARLRSEHPDRRAGELRNAFHRGEHGVLAARRRPGRTTVMFVMASFFSGLTVPLVIFPGWTRDVAMALPWANVPPGAGRHVLAGQAPGLGPSWPACCSAWVGQSSCSACAGWCCVRRRARWWSRVADVVATTMRGYKDIAVMWTRAAMAYPASFWMMAVSGFIVGLLDFVGIWIMFHTVDALGGMGPLRDRLPLRRHRLRPGRGRPGRRPGSSGSAK